MSRYRDSITVNVACPCGGEMDPIKVEMDGGCPRYDDPPTHCMCDPRLPIAFNEAERAAVAMSIRNAVESDIQGARDYARTGE